MKKPRIAIVLGTNLSYKESFIKETLKMLRIAIILGTSPEIIKMSPVTRACEVILYEA
jgi:hypothetical protein